MKKFVVKYQSAPNRDFEVKETYNTLDEAANYVDRMANGEYNHAAIEAIKSRGYYGFGYGSSQAIVEEVEV